MIDDIEAQSQDLNAISRNSEAQSYKLKAKL